jgi:putative SOS response-associated peptidase YedK
MKAGPSPASRASERTASVRKVREGEMTNDLFGFLTTDPNAEVRAIHPKAMPVILTK